jgi:AraC-like DNA-binding protein
MTLGDPRVLHSGRLSPDPRWRMASHSHDHHELIVILRGSMQVNGPGLDASCREGDVLLYPAGVAHAERSDAVDPVESVFIAFRASGFDSDDILRGADRRGRIREMARWLHADRLTTDPARRASLDALCAAMLAELLAEPAEEADPIVDATRSWVLEHIGDTVRLETLARRVGLSRFHFLRRYKAATGRTPMEDVRAIRIDHARGLLLGTGLTLKEIAPLAGLANEYSLSRAFRRAVGESPRSLRRFHEGRGRGGGAGPAAQP